MKTWPMSFAFQKKLVRSLKRFNNDVIIEIEKNIIHVMKKEQLLKLHNFELAIWV